MSDENTGQAAAAPAPEKPARVQMPEQNGIRRPKPETEIGQIWKTLDDLSATLKRPATRAEGREAVGTSANPATFATQYARWTKFYDVSAQLKAQREQETAARKAKDDETKQAAAAEKAKKAEERKAADEEKAKAAEAKAAEKAAADKAKQDERERKAKEKEEAKAAAKAEREAKKAADKAAADAAKQQASAPAAA